MFIDSLNNVEGVVFAAGSFETDGDSFWFYETAAGASDAAGLAAKTARLVPGEINGAQVPAVWPASSGAVVIPDTLGGFPVAEIGAGAFANVAGLASVTIPATVTAIEAGAFAGTALTTVYVAPGLESAVRDMFAASGYDVSGVSFTSGGSETDEYGNVWHYRLVGDGNGGYGAELYRGANTPAVEPAEDEYWLLVPDTLGGYPVIGAGEYAFFRCDELQSVDLPLTATSVKANAFAHCGALMYVNMEGVTEIGDNAFYNTPELANVWISAGTKNRIKGMLLASGMDQTRVDGLNFVIRGEETAGNYRLSYTVSNGEATIDGCEAIDQDGDADLVIPSTVDAADGGYPVTRIQDGAFDSAGLTSVTIPEGVAEIGPGAFMNNSGLTEVTLPSTLVYIGGDAFDSCDSLQTINVPAGSAAAIAELLEESGLDLDTAGVDIVEHEVDPYAAWAAAHGVAGARNEKDADGIENVFRYIFGMTDFSTTPLIDIAVDGANVVIKTPPVANSTGYSIAVKSSANVDGTGDVASTPLAAGGTTVIPKPSSGVRFYRLAVERSE